MQKRNDSERHALRLVINAGKNGVLQRDLWQQLDANSREGSRVALRLEKRGLIRRERELQNGRWTYRLVTTRQPATIDSILDIPCVLCVQTSRCEPGGAVSPIDCEKLTSWLLNLVEEAKGES